MNKGNALQGLGEVQARLSQHIEARQSYEAAIAVYDEALKQAPDFVYTHTNKGNALQGLGEVQVRLTQIAEAQKSFRAALAAYSRSLEIAPDDGRVHRLRGQVQERMDSLPKS